MKKLAKSQKVNNSSEDHVQDSVHESDSSEEQVLKQPRVDNPNTLSSESEDELPILSIRKSRKVKRKTGPTLTDYKELDESTYDSDDRSKKMSSSENQVSSSPVSDTRTRPGPKSSKNRKIATKSDETAVKDNDALFESLFDNANSNPDKDLGSSNHEDAQKPGPKSKKRKPSLGKEMNQKSSIREVLPGKNSDENPKKSDNQDEELEEEGSSETET